MLDYFGSLKSRTHAIQIVPLADDAFNHAKSNIAYIEAAAAGAVSVVPSWPAWRHNGMLLPGSMSYCSTTDFYEAVAYGIEHESEMAGTAKTAWEYISSRLFLSDVNEKRRQILDTL